MMMMMMMMAKVAVLQGTREEASKAPRTRRRAGVEEAGNGAGHPPPIRLAGLGKRRELPRRGPEREFGALHSS